MARSPSPRRGRYRHGLVSDTGPCLGRSWLNRSGDSLGGVDEAGAEVSAQRVPRLDAIPRFGKKLVGVHLKLLLLLLHPALHLPKRHLRVELDAPRLVAEPESLRAHAVPRQLDGTGRDAMGVVVPVERLESSGEPPEDGG